MHQCTEKSYEMIGNSSMACGSEFNNMLHPEDGLVVLQFSPDMVPQFGCFEASWMNMILLYWLYPRLVAPSFLVAKYVGMVVKNQGLLLSVYQHQHTPTWGWHHCFSVILIKSGSTGWALCDLDKKNLFVLTISGLLDLSSTPIKHMEYLAAYPWHMACGSSFNNILNPEDGLVVLQSLPNLFPQLGCSKAWRTGS